MHAHRSKVFIFLFETKNKKKHTFVFVKLCEGAAYTASACGINQYITCGYDILVANTMFLRASTSNSK